MSTLDHCIYKIGDNYCLKDDNYVYFGEKGNTYDIWDNADLVRKPITAFAEGELERVSEYHSLCSSIRSVYPFRVKADNTEVTVTRTVDDIYYETNKGIRYFVWELSPLPSYYYDMRSPVVPFFNNTKYGSLPYSGPDDSELIPNRILKLRNYFSFPNSIQGFTADIYDDIINGIMNCKYPTVLLTLKDRKVMDTHGNIYDAVWWENDNPQEIPMTAYYETLDTDLLFCEEDIDIYTRVLSDDAHEWCVIAKYEADNRVLLDDGVNYKLVTTISFSCNYRICGTGKIAKTPKTFTETKQILPKVGDTVTIADWDTLVKIHGLTRFGTLKTVTAFTEPMKQLCGKSGVLESISNNGRTIVISFDNGETFRYSTEFLATVKPKFSDCKLLDRKAISDIEAKLSENDEDLFVLEDTKCRRYTKTEDGRYMTYRRDRAYIITVNDIIDIIKYSDRVLIYTCFKGNRCSNALINSDNCIYDSRDYVNSDTTYMMRTNRFN